MSTDTRPELSRQNRYWISKHRFYELKHFCLQYKEWQDELRIITECSRNALDGRERTHNGSPSDPTFECVVRRELLSGHTDIVEKAAKACPDVLGQYVFKGVTEGLSYEQLVLQNGVPCCKETYYDSFRRFFWILSKLRK